MLEDWRQEEIKSEILEKEYWLQRFAIANGVKAELKYDALSKKWIYSTDFISGVGDSAADALCDLWKNFHSKDYQKVDF